MYWQYRIKYKNQGLYRGRYMTDIEQNNVPVTAHDTEPMGEDKPLVMRKRIRSTTYDVYVYFSKTSRETLKDKIVRMARNEVLNKAGGMSEKDD